MVEVGGCDAAFHHVALLVDHEDFGWQVLIIFIRENRSDLAVDRPVGAFVSGGEGWSSSDGRDEDAKAGFGF